MAHKQFVIFILCLFYFHIFLISSPVINTEDHPAALAGFEQYVPDHSATPAELKHLRKEELKLNKIENRLERIHQWMAEKSNSPLGIFKDPVNKWFWIWIASWGLGLILTLILGGSVSSATLGIIWLSAFAIGSIALILWLVKKFG